MSETAFVRTAVETREGAGATVRRLMPLQEFMNFDPFVLFDHFTIRPGSGFPDHPHRGFEAITYLFQGALRHADNLGNDSTVGPGGAQRFTAGRGLVHSEMPGVEGITEGIQLWINLPRRLKTTDPAYQQVDAAAFPEHAFDGGRKRTLVGPPSPLRLHTSVTYLDLHLDPGGRWQTELPGGHRGFVYLATGVAEANGQPLEQGQALFFENADLVKIKAITQARLLLLAGAPHGEPIRQHGPYVD